MRYYVETSAAVKLLLDELETVALKSVLDALPEGESLLASDLVETELRRIAVRNDLDQGRATQILDRFDVVGIPRSAFREAGVLPGRTLRSLDALHLAMASRVNADVVVSYDARLIEAAGSLGFDVMSPTDPPAEGTPDAPETVR